MEDKPYIDSQEHWEDSINADYDERERRDKEQEPTQYWEEWTNGFAKRIDDLKPHLEALFQRWNQEWSGSLNN